MDIIKICLYSIVLIILILILFIYYANEYRYSDERLLDIMNKKISKIYEIHKGNKEIPNIYFKSYITEKNLEYIKVKSEVYNKSQNIIIDTFEQVIQLKKYPEECMGIFCINV